MAEGPGRYDYLSNMVLKNTGARAAVVVVVDGMLGSGFSVSADQTLAPLSLAMIFESVAKELRADAARMEQPPPQPEKTYELIDGGKAIRCKICDKTSWLAGDVIHRYCANCKRFHEDTP